MSANGIAWLPTKEDRQKAKLELAASKRATDGNLRAEYDITQLPTQYSGNDILDNNNAGGLVLGRPWITGTGSLYWTGLWRDTYVGYFNDDPTWFETANTTGAGIRDLTTISVGSIPEYTSIEWRGYFVPRATDTYTFYTISDDASYLWIGDTAVSGYTTENAVVNNGGLHGASTQSGTVDLNAGTYYPIRIQAGNNQVTGACVVGWSNSSTSRTGDFTNLIFFKPIVNGF